ncbi:MAG: DNA polymerase IV [Nitrososphaerota archaeon]|nr:DNA polymerase IV [Nitrososphaerota archaeon]
MNDRIVIAVDLDYFFAQCEEVRRPELSGKPVVVCVFSGRTEESGAVSTSNYVARKLGVKSGMPIVTAKRMLKTNPDAVFLPVDHEYYRAVSEKIMQTLRTFSEVFEQVSVDEAFLDVSSITKGNYEIAHDIGRKIKAQIVETEKLTCSVGIAKNKLLAKMATDFRKPDGLTIIQPDEVQGFMNPLPVGKLPGVGPKTEQRMKALGIETIGDLALFDQELLAREFGRNLGPNLATLAQGVDNEPVQEREQEQLSRIITLKRDATKFDFQSEIRPLATDISLKLGSLKSKCRVIGIIVITSDLKTKSRALTLDTPTDSENQILALSSDLFRTYFETEQGNITARRVGIRVSNFASSEVESKNPNLSDFF